MDTRHSVHSQSKERTESQPHGRINGNSVSQFGPLIIKKKIKEKQNPLKMLMVNITIVELFLLAVKR